MARTVRDFPAQGEIWPVVESWASANGYRIIETQGPRRVYQKGYGILLAPMMLLVECRADAVHLEAWLRANLLVRGMSLFIVPEEVGIECGGFRLVMPRNVARNAVNQLLNQLGQPGIE